MSDAIVPVQGEVLKRLEFSKKPILAEMRKQLMEHPEYLVQMIQALFERARKGDQWATQLIMERMEGKAVQQLMIDNETPYQFECSVSFGPENCPHCGGKL